MTSPPQVKRPQPNPATRAAQGTRAATQALPTPKSLNTGDGSIGTWIGFTGLGFGVIILYGAVKGVPVFGPNGIITNAITKGELTHVGPKGTTSTSGGKPKSNAQKVANKVAGQVTSGQNLAQGLATSGPAGIAANIGIGQGVKTAGNAITHFWHSLGFSKEFAPGFHALGTAARDTGHAAGWVWDHTLGGLF